MRIWLLAALLVGPTFAQLRQVPERDERLDRIRHTDTVYEMPSIRNRRLWEPRAEFLRKQVAFSAGVLPLPEKTPLNPQVFDRLDRDDYAIEKVLLETHPGVHLGGNLYRPLGIDGPHPAVLSPHGHWTYGRLEDNARGSIPARAIHLARMGFVVFTYDMVGYNDTAQFPHEAMGGKREELWLTHILGLQTWNSIRAVDFVSSLSFVDKGRIAVTGASGGGTQTFVLAAIDNRITHTAPVNMISGIMQGGSVCENAPLLRVDTNNVEIGALFAPKPMLMVSATGDWTRNTPANEFPAVQRAYRAMANLDAIEHVQIDAGHNYNQHSREAVYSFLGRNVLGINTQAEFQERSYRPEKPQDQLALWGRPMPENTRTLPEFLRDRRQAASEQIEALRPTDSASLALARDEFSALLGLSTMAEVPAANALQSDRTGALANDGETLVFGRRAEGDRIPGAILVPARARDAAPVLVIHPEGTSWALASSETRDGLVTQLLGDGRKVAVADVFQTGRAVSGRDVARAGRRAEAYFTTFNRTDDAERVQDVLTAVTYFRARFNRDDMVLVCTAGTGQWCLVAASLAGPELPLMADMAKFDPTDDNEFVAKLFIPGIRRAGDFRAAAVMRAGGRTVLHNVSPQFPQAWFDASFAAAEALERLEVRDMPMSASAVVAALR